MEVYQRVGVVANYCRQNETSLDPVNIAVGLLAIVFLVRNQMNEKLCPSSNRHVAWFIPLLTDVSVR